MVVLQKADTNLDEVVNDINNLVNCTHCHVFCCCFFVCVCVPFFFFFVLYLRYMNEREREGREREREKLYCNGWMHVNEKKERKKKDLLVTNLPFLSPWLSGDSLLMNQTLKASLPFWLPFLQCEVFLACGVHTCVL